MILNDITAAYYGVNPVDKIYLGDELVWPTTPVYSAMPLTFQILSGGNIVWTCDTGASAKTIQYRINNGEWTTIRSVYGTGRPTFSVTAGDRVEFKGNNNSLGTIDGITVRSSFFLASGIKMNVEGNIMSLLNATDYKNITAMSADNDVAFYKLFKGCGVVSAENLILPAKIIRAKRCYAHLFDSCTSLIKAPTLPATILTNADYCYAEMFENCTALTEAPTLPADRLAKYCYFAMFRGCTSLSTVPEKLPATGLADSCYYDMFYNCSSITTAPELPATGLVRDAYYEMFYGCSKLNYIKCLLNSIGSSTNVTQNWVQGVANTGTFIKLQRSTFWTTGNSGIPNGWTVQDATI